MRSGFPGDNQFVEKLGAQGANMGNSMFLCSASGKVVDGHKEQYNLPKWLEAWDKLPESDRKPTSFKLEDRGKFDAALAPPTPPPGGLVLRVFQRELKRDLKGAFAAPKTMRVGISLTEIPAEAQRDFLWLTEAEWKALVPAKPAKGQAVKVPDAVRSRFFRFHLTNATNGLPGFWGPSFVQSGELTLTVDDVSAAGVRMRLKGSGLLANEASPSKATRAYEFQVLGNIEYSPAKKAFERFDVLVLGEDWGPKSSAGQPGRIWLGFAVELARPDVPADQRPPNGTRDVGLERYLKADQ